MARGKDKKKRKLEKKQEGDDVPKQAQKDMELDEFSSYFENSYEPKVLITYSDNPHGKTRIFGKELTRIIPNSISRYRQSCGAGREMNKHTLIKH
ncbi:putative ribosome production factor 1 [Operophtera brumata]|uniref:Putative ribosome production factor 1 n=1 Tax=Operophtera brumata TaxID=104452 RepID=A0A0L7KSW5_OPEBR|nr:putative ribosome production factor 1 [Operophtera brumata]